MPCFLLDYSVRVTLLFRFCIYACFALSRDLLIQELRGEIQQHIHNCYQVFVPRQAAGQVIPQKGGQGREDHVVGGNLCHGHGYVGSGLEGKLSVQSKVPEYTQAQGNQVAGPVWEIGKFIQQSETAHFDETGADGEKGEFQDTDKFFHEYLQNHCVWSLRRKRKRLPAALSLPFPEGFRLGAGIAVALAVPGLELQLLTLDAHRGAGGDGVGDEDVGADDAVPADHRAAA